MPVLKTNELRVSDAANCESWVSCALPKTCGVNVIHYLHRAVGVAGGHGKFSPSGSRPPCSNVNGRHKP